MKKIDLSRRQFFQTSVMGLLGLSVLSSLKVFGQERRRGGSTEAKSADLPLVKVTDDNAKAVNYVEKHSDVKKAELKVERQGVKWDKQKCENCGFFKAAGKKGAAGTCQIFPGKWVKSTAWCSTWNKGA